MDSLGEAEKYLKPSTPLQGYGGDTKKRVWIVDENESSNEVFLSATVLEQKGDYLIVEMADRTKLEVHIENTEQMNPEKFDRTEDMAELTYLNEASVLHNLKQRYQSNLIYTYSGLFCVTINPYKLFPIYTDRVVQMYRGKKRTEMPPHIYGITDQAYQQVLRNKENQSILITGESGAGKTENTKKVIQYFASVAATGVKQTEFANLEEKIIQANPVLEAFGNARTIRNDNSSRFGKFIRIHFSNTGKIAGADIEYYLLEKSRVILQQPGERSYHIFYQLLKCIDRTELKGFLKSKSPSEYRILSKGIESVDSINDSKEFQNTLVAMDILGFTELERNSLFQIVTAILIFGNISCQQRRNEEQASFTQESFELADRVGHLLGIKSEDLKKSLLKPRIKVGNEWVYQGRSAEQVEASIGALSMSLYDRMFKWIVDRINQTLDTKAAKNFFIGVLDIAGFEIFAINSFEQLCINYTNEKLQQFFNHHMFVIEQEEYRKEGIEWTFIDFGLDLQSCIDLIEKPMGLLALLDEECVFPKATDKSYVEKIVTSQEGKSPNFAKCKFVSGGQRPHFEIAHYAGMVPYTVRDWLVKNKDPLNESVVELFKKSTEQLISVIYEDFVAVSDATGPSKQKKGSKFTTVAQTHKTSLSKLLDNLYNTQPHFVRCIIPNEMKKAGVTDSQLVLHQLRCNGVLEGIRICRRGFPNRMSFEDFKHRYAILAPRAIPEGFMDGRKVSESLITALELDKNEYRIGNSKVFFKAGVVGKLEDLRNQNLSKIVLLFQARCRGWLMRKNYQKMQSQKLALVVLQKNCKNHLILRNWAWWRLFTKVKPILKVSRTEEDLKKRDDEIARLSDRAKLLEREMVELQDRNVASLENNQQMINEIRREQELVAELEDRNEKLESKRRELQEEIQELESRLDEEEDANVAVSTAKRKLEVELEKSRVRVEDIQQELQSLEEEKKIRELDFDQMGEEIEQLTEQLAKSQKEKKNLEDVYYEASSSLQSQEDRNNQLSRSKQKIETQLFEVQEQLATEKSDRSEIEKGKRRLEQDMRALQQDLENQLNEISESKTQQQKKDTELTNIINSHDESQNENSSLQKKIKKLELIIEELEEDLEQERETLRKVDKIKSDLNRDLEDLEEKLEQQGGVNSVQVDLNRKREQDLKSLQKELEETRADHGKVLGEVKRNHLTQSQNYDQNIDQLKKAKLKSDKDLETVREECREVKSQLELKQKSKQTADKSCRQLEDRLAESVAKSNELEKCLEELRSVNAKLTTELSTTSSDLDTAESLLGKLNKNKMLNEGQLEELRINLEETTQTRSQLVNSLRLTESELDQIHEQLEEEIEGREELVRILSRERQETAVWKYKYENEALGAINDLEAQKRKLIGEINEMGDVVNGWEAKASALEKIKSRLTNELEDMHVQMEKTQSVSANLEKKQKKIDNQFLDWKMKFEKKEEECQEAIREARHYNTEFLKLQTVYEEYESYTDTLKRENSVLSEELKSLQEQVSERGMDKFEMQRNNKRLELERGELLEHIEELETNLTSEQGKQLKLQLEVTQYRQEVERKLLEKEEDFDNLRKNQQKQILAMKLSLEEEARCKNDQVRLKKGSEVKILDLEEQAEQLKKYITELTKQQKRSQTQLRVFFVEATSAVEEEKKVSEDIRANLVKTEKKNAELQSEIEHLKSQIAQAERVKRITDADTSELGVEVEGLRGVVGTLQGQKRKLEEEKGDLEEELEDLENTNRDLNEKCQNGMERLSRQSADVMQLKDQIQTIEKQKSHSDRQVRELSAQLEEATESSAKTQKRQIAKLEEKIRELESGIELEMKGKREIVKNIKK
eukprot:TRINITY_DN266_c0_g1_i10.p1 TRINITY_DN266_c0_g1~~TRINITY_DN266_c0_g1_i10.p1  ORF type:complete len:1836 (+),score=613.33 TRINITY_DN266_c0_g1_i10:92-5599(+)